MAWTAAQAFFEKKLVWKEIRTYATPRRLVLHVSELGSSVEERIEGPPVSIAFDPTGQPTDAAKGFAKKLGVSVSQLKREETQRGERLVSVRRIPVAKVLGEMIPQILAIPFVKTMRWDDSGVRFARPVRWLLALYGSQRVPCEWGKVKSGNLTYGTRRSGSKPVSVKSVSAYFETLRRLKVQLGKGLPLRRKKDGTVKPDPKFDPRKTRKRKDLLKRLRAAALGMKGRLADETTEEFNWLLTTVTFLAEDPVVAVGSFEKAYLDLPPEVLATSMAKHLKLFGVYTSDRKTLLPKFLAVLEGRPSKSAGVVSNIERILEARFSDARFFYREDTRTPLKHKVGELEKVVFHERMGTVAERIPRLKRLMHSIAGRMSGLPAEVSMAIVDRAAELCKADLVTQMVREFPSLQGAIGAHYAKKDGELETVWQAIGEIYRPRTANDRVPATGLGAILGLADRLDTLVGYFGVGLKPSGSLDPYGLRRQALGAVRILIEPPKGGSFVGLSIDSALEEAIQSWGSRLTTDPKTLKKEIRSFLRERFEWLAFVQRKVTDRRELIEAILAAGEDDLAGAWERLSILCELWNGAKTHRSLLKAAKVAERTGRIVKAAKPADGLGQVDPAVFKESTEKKLWESWNRLSPVVKEQIQRRAYAQAVSTYSALYPEIHQFFETVFVMDEDPNVRRNRLALMNEIHQSLAGHFADLSRIPLPAQVES